jgi:quercetin dioxygenase-like cupin family protein
MEVLNYIQIVAWKRSWRTDLLSALHQQALVFGGDLTGGHASRIEPHSHEPYQLDYIRQGKGFIKIAGQEYAASSGDIFMSNANEEHYIETHRQQQISRLMLKFTFGEDKQTIVFPNYLGNLCGLPEERIMVVNNVRVGGEIL